MANSNLIMRLIMDVSKYDGGLQKAQKSLDKFIDKNLTVNGIMENAAGAITKFVGAIGLAVGGMEAMNKVLHSSQALGDEWDNTLNSCKMTVDAFFQSLSTGNWDAFNGGLTRTIANMKELSALRDSLADAKLSMGFNTRTFERKFAELEGIVDDQTKSKSVREAAYKEMRSLIDNFQRDVADTQKGTEEALLKSLSVRFGRNDFTLEDIDKYISINNNDFSTRDEKKALVEYQKQLKELENQQHYNVTSIRGGFLGGFTWNMEDRDVTKQIEDLKAQNAELEKQNILNNDNDKERKQMIEDYEYALELQQKGYEYHKRSLEKQSKILGLNNNEKGVAPLNNDQLNEEIKAVISGKDALSEEVLKAISTGKTLPVLTQPIQAVMVNSEDETVEGEDPTEALRRKVQMYELAQSKIQEYTKMLSVANEDEKKYLNEQIDIWKQYANGLNPKDDGTEKLTSGLEQVSASLMKMGGLSDSVFGSMLNYIGGITGAVAEAIPAIDALINAQNMQAEANTKAAVSGSASSVASIPIVGPMMAIAAVASVLAAIMSVPSFAEGGFVPGHNYMDGITARVSSGEMIMNEADQKRLYDSIHSGNLGNGGGGRAIVTGEQIVTVINNYGKRTGKGVILKG